MAYLSVLLTLILFLRGRVILPLGMIDGKTVFITDGHYTLGAVHAGILGCA